MLRSALLRVSSIAGTWLFSARRWLDPSVDRDRKLLLQVWAVDSMSLRGNKRQLHFFSQHRSSVRCAGLPRYADQLPLLSRGLRGSLPPRRLRDPGRWIMAQHGKRPRVSAVQPRQNGISSGQCSSSCTRKHSTPHDSRLADSSIPMAGPSRGGRKRDGRLGSPTAPADVARRRAASQGARLVYSPHTRTSRPRSPPTTCIAIARCRTNG